MTSAAQIAANRRNALKSTGPRTALGKARSARNVRLSTGPRTSAGKARVAQNARRHGLTVPAAGDPAWSLEIAKLACAIAGPEDDVVRRELALAVAAAQIDVMRARRARGALLDLALREGGGTTRLAAIDRYETRALARRAWAIINLAAADEACLAEQTEPNAAKQTEPNGPEQTEPNLEKQTEPNLARRP